MSMVISTQAIRGAGQNMDDIAQRMSKLSKKASSLSNSISSCYMRGGVGGRPAAVASQLSGISSKLEKNSDNLITAACLYERKEAELTGLASRAANIINNGYTDGWMHPELGGVAGAILAGSTIAANTGTPVEKHDSGILKFLKNDLKSSGSKSSKGNFDFLHYKTGVSPYLEWDLKKGNAGVGVKASASGSVVHTEKDGRYGLVSGGYEVNAISGEAEAKANLHLMSGGKIRPKVEAKAKAEAQGISGKVEGSFGSDDYNIHLKGEGAVGKAKAEAKGQIGVDGVGGKVEVGAAVLSGKATGGFTIFGIKVDASVKGELVSVGASAEAGITDSSIEIGGKLSFLAGIGLKIKISW